MSMSMASWSNGKDMREIKGLCENCGKRPATNIWLPGGGATDMVRSHMQQVWCKHCVLTAQLEHAKQRAAKIPEIEAELAALEE